MHTFVRWVASSRRGGGCASAGGSGPGSASPTTSSAAASSGRPPVTRREGKIWLMIFKFQNEISGNHREGSQDTATARAAQQRHDYRFLRSRPRASDGREGHNAMPGHRYRLSNIYEVTNTKI